LVDGCVKQVGAKACVTAVEGHPRSFDIGTNRKRVCDFLLVINNNADPILQLFKDRRQLNGRMSQRLEFLLI